MFYTVQTQLHTTNQKLEGNVWEICVKSLLFSNWTFSVFQHIWICEMFGTVHLLLHAIKQKNLRIGKKYIIITLCLTSQAIDSPVLTKLFTWGRHRNTSVTKTCFRHWSSSAVQVTESKWIFTKDYPNFMTVYRKETAKPYGYVLINNQEWETSQTIDKKKKLKLQHSRNRLRYKLKKQKTTKPKAKKKKTLRKLKSYQRSKWSERKKQPIYKARFIKEEQITTIS